VLAGVGAIGKFISIVRSSNFPHLAVAVESSPCLYL
jgi:hypothetical protein